MPRKLTLELEHLSVESFHTAAPQKPRGTVFGEQCTCPTACTCPGCPSCNATCAGQQSCGDSCADTCAQTCVNTCDDATCAAWCTDTNYGCGYESCLATDCGPYYCCA
jgi:hypothetical protein